MLASLLSMGCSSSCDPTSDGPSTVGELGNGFFSFECVGFTDAACRWTVGADVGPQETFPGCLALNGTFDLEYTLQDSDALDDEFDAPLLFVEPASEAYVQRTDPFVALQEGRAAMLARADEQVVDFIHFTVVQPDSIELREADGRTVTTSIEMATGERRFIRVLPRSSRCSSLGGALPLTAASADESVVTATTSGVLELQGEGLGTTTVTVDLGLVQTEITVVIDEIGPEPDTDSGTDGDPDPGTGGDTDEPIADFPLDATATEGGDTDTDTGTDTDAGTGTGGEA